MSESVRAAHNVHLLTVHHPHTQAQVNSHMVLPHSEHVVPHMDHPAALPSLLLILRNMPSGGRDGKGRELTIHAIKLHATIEASLKPHPRPPHPRSRGAAPAPPGCQRRSLLDFAGVGQLVLRQAPGTPSAAGPAFPHDAAGRLVHWHLQPPTTCPIGIMIRRNARRIHLGAQ